MPPLPAAALGVICGVILLLYTKKLRSENKLAHVGISFASFILSIAVAGYAADPYSEIAGARVIPLWLVYLVIAYFVNRKSTKKPVNSVQSDA